MKMGSSIDEHLAKFKMLAAEAQINMSNALTIELLKETLPSRLREKLMNLETPLNSIDDWYKWAATLDHHYHKIAQVKEQT